MRFEEDSLVIPSYFGRDFRIPLRAEGVALPSAFIKYYPFEVKGMLYKTLVRIWRYRINVAV
jgi:hypothetical protein